jgi:hypothetical protein
MNTTFRDHSGSSYYFATALAPKLKNYFPSIYFKYAQAAVVRITVKPPYLPSKLLNFQTNFTNCSFLRN